MMEMVLEHPDVWTETHPLVSPDDMTDEIPAVDEPEAEVAAETVVQEVAEPVAAFSAIVPFVRHRAGRTADRRQLSTAFVVSILVHAVVVVALLLVLRYATRAPVRIQPFGFLSIPEGAAELGPIGALSEGMIPHATSPMPDRNVEPLEDALREIPDEPAALPMEHVTPPLEPADSPAVSAFPAEPIAIPHTKSKVRTFASDASATAGGAIPNTISNVSGPSSPHTSNVAGPTAPGSGRSRTVSGAGMLNSGGPSGNQMPITYPEEAKRRRYEGTAIIYIHVAASGDVDEVRLVKSSGHALLDDAAVSRIRQWKYSPPMLDGEAVDVGDTIPVTFTLH